MKFNGTKDMPLEIATVKQVSGRAGRYRTSVDDMKQAKAIGEARLSGDDDPAKMNPVAPLPPAPQTGYVTTLHNRHYHEIRRAMESDAEPLKSAGIIPTDYIISIFCTHFAPSTPFSYVLRRLYDLVQMHPRFHLCSLRDQIPVADLVQPVPGLTVTERITLCNGPVNWVDARIRRVYKAYARCIATQRGGALLDIPEVQLELLDRPDPETREELGALESLHQQLMLYLWLSYRFVGVFPSQDLTFHVKEMVEEKIRAGLQSKRIHRETLDRKIKKYVRWEAKTPEVVGEPEEDSVVEKGEGNAKVWGWHEQAQEELQKNAALMERQSEHDLPPKSEQRLQSM